ncbi:MAG: hypothetical protein LR011_05150 [Verrucomicrobia bacterium]|nr:hypothetical protein [Verrucomicrobiota bacterium]
MKMSREEVSERPFCKWCRFLVLLIASGVGVLGVGQGQTFTVMPPFDSGTYVDEDGDLAGYGTYALAVSGDGSTIVGYGQKANGTSTAFVWKDGVYTEIPFNFAGRSGTEIFISPDGDRIFGWSLLGRNLQIREQDGRIVPGSYGPWISFNREYEGQRSPVGGWNRRWDTRSGNSQRSVICAISDDFTTAVGEKFNETTKRWEAAIWKGNTAVILSPKDDATYGIVTGVSADGAVACGYFGYETDFRQTGFVWTEDDGVVLISELITNSGLQWHPALPLRPRAVSADGTTVIGDVEGYIQGFAEGLATESDPYQDMAWHLVLKTPPVKLTLDPDKPDYDLEETFTARVRVRHQLPDPASYAFQGMIVTETFDGVAVSESGREPLLEIRESETQRFELTPGDRGTHI